MKLQLTRQEHFEFLRLTDLINKKEYFFDLIKKNIPWFNNFDILYEIKEVDNYGSGGNFFHLFMHLNNDHIIAYHYATNCLEYSFKPWKSINEYINDDDEEEGFGYEANNPNHDNRIIENISIENQEEA